ncbi:MAG: hypothetical protein MJ215_05110 [Spirochaetia bacterium]|nr:hypothetical protein [Spirochaetia bacterium]
MRKQKSNINYIKLDEYINDNLCEKEDGISGFFRSLGDRVRRSSGSRPPVQYVNPVDSPRFGRVAGKLSKTPKRSASFVERLLYYIDKKNMTNPQVYNAAGIKPDCFSKIISGKTKRAEKNNVISLIFALKLDLEEAEDLLESAQYRLLDDNQSDIIIKFCLEENSLGNNAFTIDDVNEALAHYGLPLIGGVE